MDTKHEGSNWELLWFVGLILLSIVIWGFVPDSIRSLFGG